MHNRPWPIIILALVQVLAPFISLVFNAHLENMSTLPYIQLFLKKANGLQLLEHFALFPIAGVATFLVKKWSYPVVIAINLWITGRNTIIWFESYSTNWGISFFIGITAVNLVLITYYLLPAVREIYFNERLRWWESLPRYRVKLPGVLKVKDQSEKGSIRDFSEGGVFIEAPMTAEVGDHVTLEITLLEKSFSWPAKIVHKRTGEINGYGLQFELNKELRSQTRSIIFALKALGCELTSFKDPLVPSFFTWLSNLKSGKGFVPNIPGKQG